MIDFDTVAIISCVGALLVILVIAPIYAELRWGYEFNLKKRGIIKMDGRQGI